MIDRIRMAIKVLFVPRIIVVTRGEQLSTFNSSKILQDGQRIVIEVEL